MTGPLESPFFPGEPRPDTADDKALEIVLDQKAELLRAGLIRCLEHEWFRDWINGLLIAFNTYGHTFAATPGGFPDPNATFFHLGMKAAGTHILEQIDDITPDHALMLRREARKPKPQ